ncbi:MAG: hypothetical protein EBZ49_03880 [Proteobacteria bacterium]|nr:hypothetical protein [Pseudomonadota bacterium]
MDAVVRPVVKDAVPLLKLVATIFILVTFVLNNAPELTDVLASKVPVVTPFDTKLLIVPDDTFTLLALIFVPTIFVIVLFVPTIFVPTMFVLVIFVE